MLTSKKYLLTQDPFVSTRLEYEFGTLTKKYGFTPEFHADIIRNRNRHCNGKSYHQEWIEGASEEYWRRALIVEQMG